MKMSLHFILYVQIYEFVWSKYDGANNEQWAIGYGWRHNQEAKLKIVGEAISWSNHLHLDPEQKLYNICNCVVTLSIVLTGK